MFFTGGSLNPARSFGPDAVLGTFDGFHYIYWIGPFFGSLVAVLFYKIVKALEYETANPGQDQDEKEARKYKPQTKPNPNSSDPPGVERAHSSHDRQGRSERRGPGASYSRDGPNHSRNSHDNGYAGARSHSQYHNGPRAERGEIS